MESDDRGKFPVRRPAPGATSTPTPAVAVVRPEGDSTEAQQAEAEFADRAPRTKFSVPVRFRFQSILDFVETQAMNVSRTGMFVASKRLLPVGTKVNLEFALADGYILLKGTADVVRISESDPRGMGLRFVEIEEKTRKLIERIVSVNDEGGTPPAVPIHFEAASLQTPAPNRNRSSHLPGSRLPPANTCRSARIGSSSGSTPRRSPTSRTTRC